MDCDQADKVPPSAIPAAHQREIIVNKLSLHARAFLAIMLMPGAPAAFAWADVAQPVVPAAFVGEPVVELTELPNETAPAVAVVDHFGQALAAGKFDELKTLLSPDVLILESGGAERSREEYLAHHAIDDWQFLQGMRVEAGKRRARVAGDMAWVGSESRMFKLADDGKTVFLSTETMVLRRYDGQWRIVHIHWSSRRQK